LSWGIALLVPVVLGIALAVVGYFAGKAEKIEIYGL
jgi:CP family cyanate transporter-like MFS transporter